jgi:hypothetical protein
MWEAHFSTSEQAALVPVAFSSQGDKYLVQWNCANCDAFSLVLAPKLLRLDQSHHTAESTRHNPGYVNEAGSVCGYMRAKQLSWKSFAAVGIKDMELTCITSDDGAPSVSISNMEGLTEARFAIETKEK